MTRRAGPPRPTAASRLSVASTSAKNDRRKNPVLDGDGSIQLGERPKMTPGRPARALTRALAQGFHGRDGSAEAARCCQDQSTGGGTALHIWEAAIPLAISPTTTRRGWTTWPAMSAW